MEMIKAFLMSAGLGTRLRPLTDETPKSLLPFNGKPLLQIWLELLNRYDVDEVLINTHWHHEKVGQYLSTNYADYTDETDNEKRTKPQIQLFYELELLGSGGTLMANKDWVADGQPFFILYGDNLTNVNLSKMYDFHIQHDLPFTIGVFKADEPERCGIVEIDENDVVVDFVEKPDKPKSDLAAAGIYMADQRVFTFFPQNCGSIRPLDLGYHVIPNLVGKMKAYFVEEFLMDIGTPESYEKAQKIYPKIAKINAD
jgi:mannose-1-phosphate guanylyltransferase